MHKGIIDIIRKNKTFLISSHARPDADAVCSCLALAIYLKSVGKKVHVLNEDDVPQWLKFLPRTDLLERVERKKYAFDAAFILDCGDLKRIGSVQTVIHGQPIVNIDHHITNDRFGNAHWVDPKASSTCEMLFRLLKELKAKMTKDMATHLYTGIMTDTGSFRYDSTSASTHLVVGELLKFDIKVNDIYRRIYEEIPVGDLENFIDVIQSVEFLSGKRIACLELTEAIGRRFSGDFDLKEKMFSFLRGIKGLEVVVIFNEQAPGETRVNFRSIQKMNVATVASFFGGGGHPKASGCIFNGDLKTARNKVIAKIKAQL